MAESTPPWLYYVFGVAMLVVAGYCLTLLVLSVATNRPAGRDVEISHLLMGVAMAGMFVRQWSFGASAAWEIAFGALLVWFVVQSVQSVRTYGLHLPHALIHAVMNAAMLLMYRFPLGSSARGAAPISMSASSGASKLDPGLGFCLAFVLLASAVFTLASPNKGASHFGSHAPAWAIASTAGSGTSGARSGPAGVLRVEGVVATPWLVDLSHVVMCVAMGFMLLLMT